MKTYEKCECYRVSWDTLDFIEVSLKTFKLVKRFCTLLNKDVSFEFIDKCMQKFMTLKEKATSTPIITTPNWSLLFEVSVT